MSQSRIPDRCNLRGRLLVDVKLDLSGQVIQTLSNAIAWWETWHKKSAPAIYVSSLYPKDFGNIDEFGPNAKQKLRGMWDSRAKAVILLANIQTMEPRMLVSILFHELGHCLKGHATEPKEGRPVLSLRQEKEAEKFAVIDYVAYYGKGAVVPQDPRIGESFYRSLGLKRVVRKPSEAASNPSEAIQQMGRRS